MLNMPNKINLNQNIPKTQIQFIPNEIGNNYQKQI